MRKPLDHYRKPKSAQTGVVLVVCLVFLVALTLLAVGGMEETIVEERIAGNIQDQNRAFQAAEASLQVAENWLGDQTILPVTSTTGSTNVWATNSPDPDTDNDPWWNERPSSWWDAGTNTTSISNISSVNAQPQYLIEQFFVSTQGNDLTEGTGDLPSDRILHRITARGEGANSNSQVLLQSTYIRPYD